MPEVVKEVAAPSVWAQFGLVGLLCCAGVAIIGFLLWRDYKDRKETAAAHRKERTEARAECRTEREELYAMQQQDRERYEKSLDTFADVLKDAVRDMGRK